jgi:hypothetical protein
MINLSWILTMPTWVVSLISALLGAAVGGAVGGLASYWASYAVEKKKWGASAAILRKDQVYSPVYDELASLVDKLKSEDGWLRIPPRVALEKWRKLSHSSLALGLPEALTQRLDRFVELCDAYVDAADRRLFQQIREAFPEKHFEQEDYDIVALLVCRMLLGLYKDDEVLDHIYKQRGHGCTDLSPYWTPERFAETRKTIENLSAWTPTKQLHNEYVEELHSLHDELGKRIRRIAERYQRAAPDL